MSIEGGEQGLLEHLFGGSGEMRQRCRELDWRQTPLGALEGWPDTLRFAARQVLAQPFPSAVYWGADQALIYNDGLRPLLGAYHPTGLGRPSREAPAGSFLKIREPLYARVLAGESLVLEDEPYPLPSGAETVNRWHTVSYTPLLGGEGRPRGALLTAYETTSRVRSIAALRESKDREAYLLRVDSLERARSEQVLRESEARQRFLLGLADRLRVLGAAEDIEAVAARMLGEHLGADRAYFSRLSERTGIAKVHGDYARASLAGLPGVILLRDFPRAVSACRAGRTFVLEDIENDTTLPLEERRQFREQLSLGALVVTPIVQAARFVGALSIGSVAPRRWAPNEIALIEEVGTRTWAVLDQRRAEAALHASEARFRTFVENVQDYAIFLVDTRGNITEWTAGAERVTGYTAPEVLGRSAALLYTAEDVTREEPLYELREAEVVGRAEREAWRVRKGGRRYWVNEIATAVRDEHGRLVGFTIISRDLSEPRRSREQREALLAAATAAHEEAERANLAKDEFLGTLGHELRTPLAAILLWGAALRSGAVAAADMGRAVDAILQSAKTQSRLVDDLLDLSRLSTGKLWLAPGPVDVADIARASCDVVEPIARSKHVALSLMVADGLGRGMFDAARLQQVLWNLLSNAIKFTPSGGRVTLRVGRSSATLDIDIIDTGEGIAPEFMPHVFERFRQANMGRTRQHTGLGIGLALCRHLVELQGGTIEAQSEGLGRGAVFCVRLPWSESAAQAVDTDGVAPLGGDPERLRGVAVLLVEDDANTREVMALTLANAGAIVVSVSSGAEALARLGAAGLDVGAPSHVDVIVSDLGLPDMPGDALIERVVQLRRSRGQGPLPACAVSAHARDTDQQRAIDAGYDLYLAKPLTPEQLVEAVEDLRDVAGTPRRRAAAASLGLGRTGW